MANNDLKLGDWNAICDVCGFKFKASQLRKRWDNAMVCAEDYEERHPSDFFRTRAEDTSVSWTRDEPEDNDVSPTRLDTTTDVPEGHNDGSL